jgi:hypothetical protein
MTITILDGGMGQELLARSTAQQQGFGLPRSCWMTLTWCAVHADYLTAGADVITTNSYVLHRDRLAPFGVEDRFEQLHRWPAGWPWKRGMPMGPVLWPDRWVPTHAPTGRTWRCPRTGQPRRLPRSPVSRPRMWTCCYVRQCRPSSRLAVRSWALEQWVCRFGLR